MKFGFVTCVQLGLACMEEIYAVGGHLNMAVSLRDGLSPNKSGRVYLDSFCSEHQIPLLKTHHINDTEVVERVKAADIDWLFIIGWSQIAGSELLSAPKRGVLGVHPTLLPEGRGRASIPWAIIKGLDRTGVTLFKLDDGVDTGPVLAQEVLPIDQREDAGSLYSKVTQAHRSLLRRVWTDLENDRIEPTPQEETRATIWPGRSPKDGEITPEMSVDHVDSLVRATTHPYPGAFFEHQEHGRIRIWAGHAEQDQTCWTDGLRFALRDGYYIAIDYDIEAGHIKDG